MAQTVAVGRCLEFLLLPFRGRIVTLYSSLWLFLRLFASEQTLALHSSLPELLNHRLVGRFFSISMFKHFCLSHVHSNNF